MRWRFMGMVMVITALVLLVQTVPLAQYLRAVETDRLITGLERDAFVLAGRAEEALEALEPAEVAGIAAIAQEYRASGGGRVVITDIDGTAVVTSDDDQSAVGGDYSTRPEIAQALAGTIATGSRFSTTLDEQLVYVAVPVISGQDIVGAVRLTYPAAVVDEEVAERLSVIGIVALLTLLMAGIAGVIFSGTVTRPLRVLTAASERLAGGDLDARADTGRGAPELMQLSSTFNRMADRLSALIDEQRAFAADASHQLRTPLTALRLKLERAHDLLESDPSGAAERLVAAERETDRLVTIVEGLLALGRAGAPTVRPAPTDLGAVARTRVEQWEALAAESGVEVRVEGAPSAGVLAIPTAVEQIIDNLLDNALAVSAEGTVVRVLVTGGERPSVSIIDEGPGMSDEELARAFDRFWRGSTTTPGTGLGLAIVAELARASGAEATLRRGDPRGLVATVEFAGTHLDP
ncbi:sensor histidine kinase [Microcella frigidaquae]|uniref:histidine kinase n=1 Tax=Microcella frigidaquae TaxID=424758 RepID=A0A840X6X5_9MICO|nr:ATP-binding protein [Microcella frigidaquae]MBB5617991.1 signal transduction histidine kinase [Microcella frigidaquae]